MSPHNYNHYLLCTDINWEPNSVDWSVSSGNAIPVLLFCLVYCIVTVQSYIVWFCVSLMSDFRIYIQSLYTSAMLGNVLKACWISFPSNIILELADVDDKSSLNFVCSFGILFPLYFEQLLIDAIHIENVFVQIDVLTKPNVS